MVQFSLASIGKNNDTSLAIVTAMFQRPFRFDPEKGLEVLLYLASKLDKTYYQVLKTLYLADRYHLENYGRLICGDRYIAMSKGVCPSGLYDFVTDVKKGRRLGGRGVDPSDAFSLRGFKIVPKRPPNLDYLSKSDLESLDRAIRDIKEKGWFWLYKTTHGPDYKAAKRNGEVPFDEMAKTLPSGDLILKALRS